MIKTMLGDFFFSCVCPRSKFAAKVLSDKIAIASTKGVLKFIVKNLLEDRQGSFEVVK